MPGTGLSISAAPSQHFSGRGLGGRNTTLWSSFVVRGPKHSVFFSGDTGLTPEYSTIAERLGAFDLVLLEVGAFHEAWGDIHLGPENALDALRLLGGGTFLPVHWGTFNLAIHAWDEPAETLVRLAPERGVELVMPRLGEPVEPARIGAGEPLVARRRRARIKTSRWSAGDRRTALASACRGRKRRRMAARLTLQPSARCAQLSSEPTSPPRAGRGLLWILTFSFQTRVARITK